MIMHRMSTRLGISQEVIRVAWVVLSDAYLRPCCLANDVVLAASAIVVGAILTPRQSLAEVDRKVAEEEWWEQFRLDTKEIVETCAELLKNYAAPEVGKAG